VKLDLLLVRPGDRRRVYGEMGPSLAAIEPPFWAALLAGHMRERGLSVGIIDADAEDLSPPDVAKRLAHIECTLLGVIVSGTNPSASTMSMPAAREILQQVRLHSPKVKTFLGGLHPSALPERTIREEPVDFVIQGEMFNTLPALFEAVKIGCNDSNLHIPGLWRMQDGGVISNPRPDLIENLDSLPDAAWDLLPMNLYRAHNWHCFANVQERQPYAVIYTSLGCPFNCSFCCINAIFGQAGIRYRSPERVLEEIDTLHCRYGVKNIKIMDEMFVLNPQHVRAICQGLVDRNYGLNIWAYARIDTVADGLLGPLKAAGFNWLAYGIESGNAAVRKGVTKGRFAQSAIKDTIRRTKDAGIHIGGNFIFGLPDDNMDTMQQTLDLACELNCEYANFYSAMAYPGSRLHEMAVAEGLPLPPDWRGYAQLAAETLPLPTRHLTGQAVLKFRDYAFDYYYRRGEYLDMIKSTFGDAAVKHILAMLSSKPQRHHAS
jgi:anaerobic magnesium-protoporphyrin IX monomethyl ester cyclase